MAANKKSVASKPSKEGTAVPILPIGAPLPLGASDTTRWLTSENSPFPDKYDIEGERMALDRLINEDNPRFDDPLWPRYEEFEKRVALLKRIESVRKMRQNADPMINDAEAMRSRDLGRLVPAEVDTMTLHTVEAYRLFIGQEKPKEGYGKTSGRRAAAVLRALHLLSGNSNPYADWVLIEFEKHIDTLRQQLEKAINEKHAVIKTSEDRGLKLHILKSDRPAQVELGFKSPYGFMLAELICDIDYFMRIVKTLVTRNKLSTSEGRNLIWKTAQHPARSIFERLLPYQRMLASKEMADLSRKDWASTEPAALKRIEFAVQCFGECPRNIFTGAITPRHARARGAIDVQELKFLEQVSLVGQRNEVAEHGLV